MLMRWRSFKLNNVGGLQAACRLRGNFSLRMKIAEFPFDSGWVGSQPSRGFKVYVADSAVYKKTDHTKILLSYNKNGPSRLPLLMDFFGVSKSQAQRITESDSRLRECDTFSLSRNMTRLKENDLDPAEVRNHLQLLYFCPLTVEHQIGILQELGLINLKVAHYKRFKKLYKSTIRLIKDHGLLPSNYDPKWSVLKPLEVPDGVIDEIKLPHNTLDLTLAQVHEELSKKYLQWRLEGSEEDLQRIRQIYPPTKMKSMKLQHQVFEELDKEWDINSSKVLRHGYLMSGSPFNLKLIKEHVKHLGGANIKDAAALAPRILNVPYHKLLNISRILTDIGVEPGAVLSLPQVCTLNPETIIERVLDLQKVPEFDALRTHPRILRLIYYNTKTKSRVDLLRQLKDVKAMPSLNILTGDTEQFHRYLTLGELKQNRRDVVTFLAKNFKVKSNRIRDTLSTHLFGPHTTVVNVKENLSHLLEKGFTEEQVLAALELVLYPPELLSDQLSHLPKRPEAQPYSKYKNTPNALQLLLYFIDKKASYRM